MMNRNAHTGIGFLRWYPVILVIGLLILIGFNSVHGQVPPTGVYVSPTGSDLTGTGSYDTPYQTFTYAISQAADWDTVVALPGTYHESVGISYTHPVHIAGYGEAGSTIVSGDSAGIVFDISGPMPAKSPEAPLERVSLIGLTITAGLPHGVQVVEWDVLIKDCVVENCKTVISEVDNDGPGIYMLYSLGVIDNCTIQNNRGGTYSTGGGICALYSAPLITDCRILNNSAEDYGGGIYFNGNIFETKSPMIVNSIVRGNSAMGGGGICIDTYNAYILNNVVADNLSIEYSAGVLIQSYAQCWFYNNIVVNNDRDGLIASSGADSVGMYIGYNDFYGNVGSQHFGGYDQGGNISVDPQFVNYGAGDYHLQESSTLIDRGAYLDSLPQFDFDGQPRSIANNVDIGPDEFADCSMTANFGANPTEGCQYMLVTFTGSVTGLYDSLMWDFGDGTYSYNTLNVQKPYSKIGTFTVKLYAITPCTTVVAAAEDLITVGAHPTADFTADVDSGCAPLLVQFADQSEGGVTAWRWDFGDGITSSLPTPSHEYVGGDSMYTVTLVVSNVCDVDTIIRQNYIRVLGAAEADFIATSPNGSAPHTVDFVDQSRNGPAGWSWDFGDGGTSELKSPQHEYVTPGIYDVELTVTNQCGTFDSFLREGYVTIYGFDLKLADTSHTRYLKTFDFDLDSLYGPFDRDVTLTAKLLSEPSRGNATFVIQDSTMSIGESSTLQASLTKDLTKSVYQGALIGTAIDGSPIDTLLFEFESDPVRLISVSSDNIDFDSTQVGNTSAVTLTITNLSTLLDDLELHVSGITNDGSDAFSVDASTFTVFPASSHPVQVTFAPPDSFQYDADITITSDDPVIQQYVVHLSGLGIPERIPPVVDYTSPEASATDVTITSQIDLYMSEPLDTMNLPEGPVLKVSSQRTGSDIPGKTLFIANLHHQWIVRFVPDSVLQPLDEVTVTLSGDVADLVGNTLDGNRNGVGEGSPTDDAVFEFQTGPGVFPGDANNDGIVNEVDVLPLGVFWMMHGPKREGGSQWRIQPAEAWSDLAATYADCNGDSIVNMEDVLVIGTNWGLTHNYGRPQFAPNDYDLEKYKGAFETMYIALEDSPENEITNSIRELISKYVGIETVPNEYTLSQNFPNPFNPTTYIQYSLPVDGHVTLTIHNILGQTVATLVDEYQDKGFKQVVWNGTADSGEHLPSGMYFYRMKTGTFTQVKKMLLLR